MYSESLLFSCHPGGSTTDSVWFATLAPPAGVGMGDVIGVGEPAGVGLGTPVPSPVEVVWLAFLELNTASAVPHPAMTTTNPTTAAMIITHGARWTGGCAAPGAGA
jgi:hypothetical protein